MLGTVVFIFGILIAVVGIGIAIKMFSDSESGLAAVSALIGVILGGGIVVGSMVGTVDTKKVGVVTSFKKPTGEIKQAGAYMTAPWKSVTEMDVAWQTANYEFNVQAAGGTTVGLDVRPRWRMVESAAPELFQNYKDFDGVVDNLFKTELVNSANKLFAGYNPLTNLDVKTGLPVKSKESWATDLENDLKTRLAGKIEFDRVAIPTIAPDPATQNKLNQQVEEFGKGKVLDQQRINADKQKLITETNAKVDPVTRCMEIAANNGTDPGTCGLLVGAHNTSVLVSPSTKK